jgi:glycosyltransferase involved in cell wall biosynthesis
MRVAYVCTDPGVPVFGTKGCSIHVQQILRSFVLQGWQVDLYARRIDSTAPRSLRDVRLFPLQRVSKSLSTQQRELRLLELDRSLALQLHQNGPYNLVYERHALWSAAGMEFAADVKIPSILEVNAPLLEEQATYRELINADRARQIVQRSFHSAGTIVAVSAGVAEYIQSLLPPADRKLHVVANGVDVDAFQRSAQTIKDRWSEKLQTGQSAQVVGFVGTLRAWHGMTVLGNAFRQFHKDHPLARLLVIGDGPAREELVAVLGTDAAAHTTITGKLPHEEIPAAMAQMDIAVAPYPELNNFYFSPLKILEYMACGLPIVASRIGDIPQLLENGQHGALVTPGCWDAVSDALDRLAGDPLLAIELGQSARAAACRQHNWDHKLRRMLQLANVSDAAVAAVRSAG